MTVNPLPAAITGGSTLCAGTTLTLADATTGGTWSILPPPGTATISAGGVVTGIVAGNAVVDYSLPTGCYILDTVHVISSAGVITPASVCVNSTVTLTSTVTGGTWSTDGLHGTVVSGTGVFTGTSPGLDTVYYSLSGCTSSVVVTVNALPSVSASPAVQLFCSATVPITTTASGGTGPGTYTYTWLPATGLLATTGTPVSVISGSSDITYTVTCTDANGCKATDTSKVVVPCGSACNACGTPTLLGAGPGGIVAGGAYSGMYYIDNDVTITASVTFNGAVVAIKPGVKITLQSTVFAQIINSHFYCCSETNIWQGFVMQSLGANTATMEISRSLIEDANFAIRFTSPAVTTSLLLNCGNTVFNRNVYGVFINTYATTSTYYPFDIQQTVFTSRNLEPYHLGGNNYPCIWPSAVDLMGYYPQPSQVYLPMWIDNPTGMPTTGAPTQYAMVGCKFGSTPCLEGIFLNYVGPTTCTPSYPGFVINGILFDNLACGIFDQNSTITVSGCHFAHIKKYSTSRGDGIYATKSNSAYKKNLFAGTSPATANYFYSCTNAVECSNYNNITCKYDSIYSDHTTAAMAVYDGNYGFNIFAGVQTGDTLNMNLNNNYIVNINYAINFGCTSENPFGFENITNNKIIAAPTDFPGGFTTMGIYAGNTAYASSYKGRMQIVGNEIYLAYNGISINNFWRKIPWSWSNDVNLRPNPASPSPEYGISYANCVGAVVGYNFVTGHLASDANSTLMTGIYGASNTAVTCSCNNSQNIYRGFSFKGTTNTHLWATNYMKNCHYGYYLNGAIGRQGGISSPTDNYWDSTWSGGGVYMTFVQGATSYPVNSKLYIRFGSAGFDPGASNGALPTINYYQHVPGATPAFDSGFFNVTTTSAPPSPCAPLAVTWRTTSDSTDSFAANNNYGLYEFMATIGMSDSDTTYSQITTPVQNWIAQMATFQAIQADSTLLDSSAILVKFDTLAQASRYSWLTKIMNAIDTGNYTLAQNLMSQNIDTYIDTARDSATRVALVDSAGADNVVQNYLAYFHLYLKYINDTLSTNDSANLAGLVNLCPETAGNIIFNARALYNIVFDTVANFGYECSDDTAARYGSPFSKSIENSNDNGQQYKLYPNPNNGNITLEQAIVDIKPITIIIYNATGATVEKIQMTFTGYINRVNLGKLQPGLYLFHIINSEGHSFNLKFTIQ